MDNNLPNDPPDEGNSTPPPFGSNFDPHSNPVDPNNPYQPPPSPQTPPPNLPEHPDFPDPIKHATYSEVAQHKLRDTHGRFIRSEHTAEPQVIHNSPQESNLPPLVETNPKPNTKGDYPPLFQSDSHR